MENINYAVRMIQEAEEYVYFIVEQTLLSTLPLLTEAADRGVKQRTIFPVDVVFPPDYDAKKRSEHKKAEISGLIQTRYLDDLDVCLAMSEKEVAGVSFATLDGRLDHLDFREVDQHSINWCKDLFNHYWEKAELLRV
jgi:predicted transcriptional regulator